jgi:methylglutaconyl-CoA hydratase
MSVCDIVVATENIKMALTETKLGLIPATISPYVISKIGSNNSIDLFTSARIFKPKEAKDMGLIKSFVDEANIDDEIGKEVNPFSMNAPDAISASKKLVRDLSIKIDLDTINFTVEALADVWENPEAIEGINAFFAKRKPAWIKEN